MEVVFTASLYFREKFCLYYGETIGSLLNFQTKKGGKRNER